LVIRRNTTRRLLLATITLIGSVALPSSCRHPEDPESPEQVLLSRAIDAIWSPVDAPEIENVRLVSTMRHPGGATLGLETWISGEDRYRVVRKSFNITEVHAMLGDEVWATVDGTLVPVGEADADQIRRQPLLFRVSQLRPLRDTKRFDLEYEGTETLDDGGKVDRLRVRPVQSPGMELVFDFRTDSHLLRRVELRQDGSERVEALVLDDYRELVAGDGGSRVKVAFKLDSYRDGRLLGTQIIEEIDFNPQVDEALFLEPAQSSDPAVIEKDCIAGLFACALHDGAPDDFRDTLGDLKDWIADNEFEVAGPLVLTDGLTGGDARPAHWVCVPVSTTQEEPKEPRKGFSLTVLDRRPALCATIVGAAPLDRVVARLRRHAERRGRTPSGPALEIYFSPDGNTRQIQLPVQ